MHFPLFVITETQPTEEMLESLLQPFRGEVEEGARFDRWALGGKYSGQVIPYDLADTMTGGPDVSDDELAILGELADCWGVDLRRPVSTPGAGVDVARFDNIKTLEIVPDGYSHKWRVAQERIRRDCKSRIPNPAKPEPNRVR